MIFGFLSGKERRGAAFGLAAAGILLLSCLGCPGGSSQNDAVQKKSEKIPVLTAILNPEKEAELKRAAENGDVKVQYQLGHYYHELYNETSDNDKELIKRYKDEAVKWLTKAAENNCADAQIELSGTYHSLGSTICYLNYIEAARWIVRAAEQNNPEALYKLGWNYYVTGGSWGASHDIVLRHDLYKAYKWWSKAAEMGNADAQFEMGNFYYSSFYKNTNGYSIGPLSDNCYLNGKERLEKAEKWYKAAAEQGHKGAKETLEHLKEAKEYYDSNKRNADFINYLKNEREGFRVIEFPMSVFDIGDFDPAFKRRLEYFYDFKDDFTADGTILTKRLRRDARNGCFHAQLRLAELYEGIETADKEIDGLPVEKRIEEAEKWYNAAAESGELHNKRKAEEFQKRKLLWEKSCMNTLNAEDKYEAGCLYSEDNGILFAYDPEKSLELIQQSAQEGFAEAQYELAEYYASRVYLDDALKSDDISKAEKWYRAAAEQGHEDAENRLEAIKQVKKSAAAKTENALTADDEYQLSRLINTFPLLLTKQEARQYLFNAAKHGSLQARDEIIKTADILSDPHSANYNTSYDELASRLKKATEYYKAACAYGDAHAQNRLAEINRQSDEHLQKINSLSKKASEGKADDEDLRKLAELYINNRFAHRNPQKAAELKCQLAQKGYSKDAQDLCWMASAEYRDKSEPCSIFEDDYIDRYNDNFDIKAFREQEASLRKEAAAGNIEASYKLGCLYYSAKENSIIYRGSRLPAARKYWMEAALKGHAGAQYCLKDLPDESMEWLLMAAEQGHAPAMYELSLIIYNQAVKNNFSIKNADPKKAFELCLKSAEQGYPKAQLLLGKMYSRGTGVKADPAEAEKWFDKAIQNGNYVAGFYSCLSKYGLINYL